MAQQEQVNVGEQGKQDGRKTIEYFVNGESQKTTEDKLSVKTILAHAGFEPENEWILSRDKDGHEFQDLDELVKIRKGERFTATYRGPTPIS